MPSPKSGYYLKDGSRVPGVTTVIGRFKDSGGLIGWAAKVAYEQGRNGKPLDIYADRAADVGTLAHALVEARIKGLQKESDLLAAAIPPETPTDLIERAFKAFGAYESWERHTRLRILDTEVQLISEEHRFGGTLDAVGEIDLELCLLDWKTSNGIYVDHLVQLAAYRHLWNETQEAKLTGGCHLLRFAKEHGDFAHHYFPDLDDAWELFMHFRRGYDLDKALRKRVG